MKVIQLTMAKNVKNAIISFMNPVGAGVERFGSSHSMQSNPSTGCSSLTSAHCCKLFISLVCMVRFA